MNLTVYIERTKEHKTVELPSKTTVKDLLTKLSLNPVAVLVVREGKVLIEQQALQDKDQLKILSVVSGG
ncbi:MoaD/ThiS family protein [Candidatus Woesearchaeota archaeon]|nr:MoaD/ThiS family protein [Candidatus Woesearchaeota archaeon]